MEISKSIRIYPVLAMVIMFLGWEAFCLVFSVPKYLIPRPSQVMHRVLSGWNDFLIHGLITSWEVALSFCLSVAVGIPLAILISSSPILEASIYPLLVSSQAIPKVAIAPIFLVWFGFGIIPKVLVGLLVAFFPIVISTIVGLEATDRNMYYLARSMGGGTLKTFLKIRLPNALPSIFGGLKISIALAVVGAIVGEFIGADRGIGYLLVVAGGNMDAEMVFASIVVLSFIGILFFLIINVMERLIIPWKTNEKDEMMQGAF